MTLVPASLKKPLWMVNRVFPLAQHVGWVGKVRIRWLNEGAFQVSHNSKVKFASDVVSTRETTVATLGTPQFQPASPSEAASTTLPRLPNKSRILDSMRPRCFRWMYLLTLDLERRRLGLIGKYLLKTAREARSNIRQTGGIIGRQETLRGRSTSITGVKRSQRSDHHSITRPSLD